MKKTISLMLAFIMIFSLCGCEEKTTDVVDTAETTTTTAETESEKLEEDIVPEETPIISEEGKTTSPVVYRTVTGKKYHRESCIHLKSKIETTVTDAHSMGLEPCSVCQPPQ